jgi:hypothetical protein
VISASKVREGFARLREAIPVQIDGPPDVNEQHGKKCVQIAEPATTNVNISLHTTTNSAIVATPITTPSTTTAQTIIRPIVIETPIRTPIVIKPATSAKPIITATKQHPTIRSTFDPTAASSSTYTAIVEQSPNSSFRTFVPQTTSPPVESRKSTTYGATGPLPGKIITKENLVLKPDGGIDAKPKPAVPPKPKGLSAMSSNKPKIDEDTLLAPLESILNDASDLSAFLSQGAKPRQRSEERKGPSMISVQCADEPEVQKLHFLNGEIPYTLTMRNVHSDTQRAIEIAKNRKSLDLVSIILFEVDTN